GSAYVITGEPGIGKTRLLSEFTRVAALQRLHIVRVGCQSHDVRRPLSVFVDLVPKLLALPGALGCSPESMQLLRRLVAHDPEEARNREEGEEASISYTYARHGFLDLLESVSSEELTVVEVEDIQWLDPHSVRMLEEISNWLPTHRALLLLTSRINAYGSERISTIMLRPLVSEMSEVVAQALVSRDVAAKADFVYWCVTSSGGNPYYLIELLRNGTIELSGYRPSTSLTRLVQNRVSLLSGAAKSLLEACCILGTYSTLERLESCIDMTRTCLLQSLAELDASGMIEVDGQRVGSRHDILSSAVLSQMSEAVKIMLHRYAASHLEAESDLSQSVALIWESAEHWLAASDAPRALLLLRRCGNYLMDVGMPDEAAQVLERADPLALDPREKYAVGAERARALVRSEHLTEALAVLDQLLVLRGSLNPTPPMLDEVRVMYMLAKWDEGYAIPSLIAEVLDGLSSNLASVQERVSAAVWLLMAADNLCDVNFGRQVYSRIEGDLGADTLSTETRLACEMTYHCAFGDASIAGDLADELCAYAAKNCPRDVSLRYLRYATHVHRCHSSAEQSYSVCLRALEQAERINASIAVTSCLSMLLGHALQNGDLAAATKWMGRATSTYIAGNRTVLHSNLLSYRTEFAIRCENVAEARIHLASCRAFAIRNTSARSLMRTEALDVLIKVTTGETISTETVESLSKLFEITKCSSMQDFSVESIIFALKSRSENAKARSISSNFVAKYRRDRSPLSPYLESAMSSISL
ncbi:MAG: AAA family ATPase, partial [Candidatus Kapaibacterium sp.]